MISQDTSFTKNSSQLLPGSRMTPQNIDGERATYANDGDGLRRSIQDASGTMTMIWDSTDYLGEIS
jgi:hypothetical protein